MANSGANLLSLLAVTLHMQCFALDNGFPRPAMGWNPWNCFGVDRKGGYKFHVPWAHGFNDTVVRKVADAMVSSGLADAGYRYVNLDCGWTTGFRDQRTGEQIVNQTRYPYGMKSLGDYIHSKGLKYGIYTSASTSQCCSKLYEGANDGSLDHEAIDAKAYVNFGVDYLKFDGCGQEQRSYPAMRSALNSSGRHILVSVNGLDMQNVKSAGDFANSWRTTPDDDYPFVSSLLPRAFLNNEYAAVARPGQFNDADMLEVGNNAVLGNVVDARSHFSLWCIMKSPLIIGTDVTNITQETLEILTNGDAIAVNQDPLGLQAFVVWHSSTHLKAVDKKFPAVPLQSVWAGPLEKGAFTVLLLNAAKSAAKITLTRDMLTKSSVHASPGTVPPPSSKLQIKDIWTKRDLGVFETEYSAIVKPHDVLFLKLMPVQSLEWLV